MGIVQCDLLLLLDRRVRCESKRDCCVVVTGDSISSSDAKRDISHSSTDVSRRHCNADSDVRRRLHSHTHIAHSRSAQSQAVNSNDDRSGGK